MNAIKIELLNKFFGKKQVLFDIELEIPKGQMTALLGPSGSENPRYCVILMHLRRHLPAISKFLGERFKTTAILSNLHVRIARILVLYFSSSI